VVAFVKEGNIHVWEEATGRSQTIFDSGDVIAVTMSDDAQVIAFLRRSVVTRSEMEWLEQSALWATDLNGGNPRELLAAEDLRALLNASETDSTNIPQMEWIPGTHRLLYSGWTYFVQAEGESHATPSGLYLADADTLTNSVLLPAANHHLRFAPSPDGQQIALISTSGLGFIQTDGSSHHPDVFPYAQVSMGGQAFPSGVWTQDGRAFLLATYLEKSLETDPGLAIWRVPLEGSPARLTDLITGSHPDSVTFSPDGLHAAFFRGTGGPDGWFVVPLQPQPGSLAVLNSAFLFWQNIHWSPDGTGFAIHDKTLSQLCPDASQDAEVCGEILSSDTKLRNIHWLDAERFLYVTFEPYDLYFGRIDGASVLLAEGAEKFSAAAMTCQNDSEVSAGGEGPAYASVTADTLFQTTWRIKNTGTCTWNSSYRIAFLGGERLNGPRGLPLRETIPPAGEIDISVTMVAPMDRGTFAGQWQLYAPDGRPFGVRLPVHIEVPSFEVKDLQPDQIVSRIPTGTGQIIFGEDAIWVITHLGNTVSRIDPAANEVAATIPVGEFLQALAFGHGAVWVAGSSDGTIARIDSKTNAISTTNPVVQPLSSVNGVAVGGGSVWVSSGSEHTVSRIDPDNNVVIATIPVEPYPSQIAFAQNAVWITHTASPVLTRIDTDSNQISTELDLECSTREIAADEAAIWVACDGDPVLFRIDPLTNRIVARIAIGNHSQGIALGSGAVWVTSLTDHTLTSIDPITNQVTAVYRVGSNPVDVVAARGDVWVALSGENSVWRIRP
jgi:YVTN family beta-propeller protein